MLVTNLNLFLNNISHSIFLFISTQTLNSATLRMIGANSQLPLHAFTVCTGAELEIFYDK